MTKQKHGFLVFIASLIPGAGEMYMGFRKQGISIMLLFWGTFALTSVINMGWIMLFLPILWFYSFFNVHNLKSLPEEDFYSVEDSYILHLDQFIGRKDSAFKKHRTVLAVLLILFGAAVLWNDITDILYWILPSFISSVLSNIFFRLPGIVIAVAIIAAGVYMLRTRTLQSDQEETAKTEEEHYWEPYRPYQQPAEPADAAAPNAISEESGDEQQETYSSQENKNEQQKTGAEAEFQNEN